MTNPEARYGLFEVIGIELEYMIVDRQTLDVRPLADALLVTADGEIVEDIERGPIAWSNELVLHVIELKTNGPAASLAGLVPLFQQNLDEIDRLLAARDACLLAGGAHPWMDPDRETRLWPHGDGEIYAAFDRVFGCKGHGWANLQSLHLNLPFRGDDEFGRLHAAIRFLMPLLPALAASTPVLDGRLTGWRDSRLETYRYNCRQVPQATAAIIPEPAYTRADYDRLIFQPLFAAIAPHDPEGIMREEWLNARGAIARFSRGSIEIRVLDVQECPAADIAVAGAVTTILQQLAAGQPVSPAAQMAWPTEALADLLHATIRGAETATIANLDYLAAWGLPRRPTTAGTVWRYLADRWLGDTPAADALQVILREGTLSSRLIAALGPAPDRQHLNDVYRELAKGLLRGALFHA